MVARLDFDPEARERLVEKVEAMGGCDPDDSDPPAVSLEDFFVGNRDWGSIGCNLPKHPGVHTFFRVLGSIRGKPEVGGVYVRLTEVDDDEAWPFSDTVYIYTRSAREVVAEWVEELGPDEVIDCGEDASKLHPLTPRPPEGMKLYVVWWD